MINNIFNIPHNPHYVNRYIKFIENIKSLGERDLTIKESHHILPRAKTLFPQYKSFKDHPWNKIDLTPKEHFIAHLILSKCFYGVQRSSSIFPLIVMSANKHIGTSRKYERLRTKWMEEYKKCPPPRKPRSKEHCRKISEFAKTRIGKLNSNYGNRYKFSDESRKKLSESRKGRIFSDQHRKSLSIALMGHEVSQETRDKISKANKGKVGPCKGQKRSEEFKQKIKETHWSRNGGVPWNKGKKTGPSWNSGKKMSKEYCQKISDGCKGRIPWNKGKTYDQPSPLKGKARPKVKCPHCEVEMDVANIKRYHFDNCKTLK